jgi:hypothetical protein
MARGPYAFLPPSYEGFCKKMNKEEYRQYLRSDHWQTLRAAKMSQPEKRRCGVCGSRENVQVHHLRYRNIFDVQTDDLRRLCDRCHSLFHRLVGEGLEIKSESNNGRWALTKTAIKKALRLSRENLFVDIQR